jgi:hypothetical protein
MRQIRTEKDRSAKHRTDDRRFPVPIKDQRPERVAQKFVRYSANRSRILRRDDAVDHFVSGRDSPASKQT